MPSNSPQEPTAGFASLTQAAAQRQARSRNDDFRAHAAFAGAFDARP